MLLFAIELFLVNILMLSFFRGLHRYSMINKYHYDYYGDSSRNLFQKLIHNFNISFLSAITIAISIGRTIIEYLILDYYNFDNLMKRVAF